MKRIYTLGVLLFAVLGACWLGRGNAEAAPACSMNQNSLPDLIANYNPPASTTSTTLTINSGTLTYTCTGLGTSGNAQHVHVFVSGSSGTTYTTPFLTGPNAFQLSYTPCIPGSLTCNATTSVWNKTTGEYKDTKAINGVNTIPSFLVFVGRQDAFFGSVTAYTGSLFFSFECGDGGSQAPC